MNAFALTWVLVFTASPDTNNRNSIVIHDLVSEAECNRVAELIIKQSSAFTYKSDCIEVRTAKK